MGCWYMYNCSLKIHRYDSPRTRYPILAKESPPPFPLRRRTAAMSGSPPQTNPYMPHKPARWAVRFRVEPAVTPPALPYRPVRERCTHTVPRSPAFRRPPDASLCYPASPVQMGWTILGGGQNGGLPQLLELLPPDRALAPPATQPVPPRLPRLATDCLSQTGVPPPTIVPKVPA